MPTEIGEILLKNNQIDYADVLTFYTKTFKGAQIDYTLIRGADVESGRIYLSYDRFTNTAKITTIANFNDVGVVFCAETNMVSVRLLYTSTDTGVQPILKYNTTTFTL
jgi:hypothetical protein